MKAPGSDLDKAFSRFARTGDVDALAFVFDQTAAKLTLVATRLVGDGHAAEDLVQQVFLEAIRGAPGFRPGAPVLPWLWTILARRARRHRPKSVGNHGLSAPTAEEEDPQHRAISRETVARIAAAVEDLPRPYREVVSLRLLHGLSPTEISTALDRPLGTVHTQMHRGLERLRRALPSGIAGALAGLSGTESLSAGIRTEVLRQVGLTASTALAHSPLLGIGGLMSKNLLLAGAALALLVSVLVLYAPEGEPAPTESLPGIPGNVDAITTDAVQLPDLTDGFRQELVARPEPTVTFRGRVLAADTGQPLPGARIETLPGPVTATSMLDGSFLLTCTRGAAGMTVGFPGYLEASAELGGIDTDVENLELGGIHLQAESRVSVRVLDAEGEPVEDYMVTIAREMGTEPVIVADSPVPFTIPRGSWTHTDHRGHVGPILLRPGRFTLMGDHALGTYPEQESRPLDLKPHGNLDLEIHLRPENPDWTLHGMVVDPSGNPLPGILLDLRFGEEPEPLRLGGNDMVEMIRSRKDGSVWLSRTGQGYDNDAVATLSSRVPGQYTVVEPSGGIRLPARGLRIVVRQHVPGALAVRAVDPLGRPLDRFTSRAFRLADEDDDGRGLTSLGHHPDGVERLEDLEPGPHLVWVRGEVEGSLYFGRARVTVAEGETVPVDVEVGPPTDLLVEVVDDSGRPEPGLVVEALTTISGRAVRRTDLDREWQRSLSRALRQGLWFDSLPMVLARGTSDQDGLALLRVPVRAGGDLTIQVWDRSSDRLGYLETLQPEADRVRVTVPSATAITGTLEPPDLLTAWNDGQETTVTLALTTTIDGRTRTVKLDAGDVDEDGRFRVDGLRAGTWKLELDVGYDRRTSVGGGTRSRVATIPFAELELRPGEEGQLRVDATATMPGTLEGSVFVDGEPVSGTLVLVRDDGVGFSPPVVDGQVRQLAPQGRWRAFLDEPWLLLGPVTVVAGAVGSYTFSVSTARLRVRLVDGEGEPLADRMVNLVPAELASSSGEPDVRPDRGRTQTDSEGVLVVDPAPSEQVYCVVWPAGTRLSFVSPVRPDGERAEPELIVGPLRASRSGEPELQTVVVERR